MAGERIMTACEALERIRVLRARLGLDGRQDQTEPVAAEFGEEGGPVPDWTSVFWEGRSYLTVQNRLPEWMRGSQKAWRDREYNLSGALTQMYSVVVLNTNQQGQICQANAMRRSLVVTAFQAGGQAVLSPDQPNLQVAGGIAVTNNGVINSANWVSITDREFGGLVYLPWFALGVVKVTLHIHEDIYLS